MKSSEPFRARATAEINIYDTLDAVEHFAAHYPAERLDIRDANRLLRAAALWIKRAAAAKFSKIDQAAPVIHGRLGPVPPVDPDLQRLLDNLKNNTTPARWRWTDSEDSTGEGPPPGNASLPCAGATIGRSERNADL
jgi:cation transport regulator ChaC